MEIDMSNIQGRLLLEESRYLIKEYHNLSYDDGCGRGGPGNNWWERGNGENLQYFLDTSFIKYDFNCIWKIMN